MKADSIDAFRQGIDALGFVDGYAVIGLKMILRKVWGRDLIKSVRRRKEILKAYNYRYYREHKAEHREYMRNWRKKRLQRVTVEMTTNCRQLNKGTHRRTRTWTRTDTDSADFLRNGTDKYGMVRRTRKTSDGREVRKKENENG